jgi:hypothetical protein
LSRRALELTQTGVPSLYAERIAVSEFEPPKSWPNSIFPDFHTPMLFRIVLFLAYSLVRLVFQTPFFLLEKLFRRYFSFYQDPVEQVETAPDSPIDLFLYDVFLKLCDDIPHTSAFDAVQEAKNHLCDHADQIVSEGVPRPYAEKMVVEDFDTARDWTRDIISSHYNSKYAHRAKYAALTCFALILGVFSFEIYYMGSLSRLTFYGNVPQPMITTELFLLAFAGLSVLVYSISCLVSKLYFPKPVMALFLIGALVTFGLSVKMLRINPVRPEGWQNITTIAQEKDDIKAEQSLIHLKSKELNLLLLGNKFYNGNPMPNQLPSSLMSDGKYIVPVSSLSSQNLWDRAYSYLSTLRIVPEGAYFDWHTRADYYSAVENMPYKTDGNIQDARRAWKFRSPHLINVLRDGLREFNTRIGKQKNDIAQPYCLEASLLPMAIEFFLFAVFAALNLLLTFIARKANRVERYFRPQSV